MSIEPDTKDWTWVLKRRCPECGLDPGALDPDRIGAMIRTNAATWTATRHRTEKVWWQRRPDPQTWSPLEYACHVRDVHLVMAKRVATMLTEDDPLWPNWDQDAAAGEQEYAAQPVEEVLADLTASAEQVAATYDALDGAQWQRPGRRSDGTAFTVASLARYHLHDVVHHVVDIGHDPATTTITAYDADAAAYAAATASLTPELAAVIDSYAAALPPGSRVLEIGSGSGRDARRLEQAGLSVRRTDITGAFVQALRDEGLPADRLDPLHDDLADPERDAPYDGVFANACLLHVAREDLPTVLGRLAGATRPDGMLQVGLKAGDGEGWSTHGTISTPRFFTYWRPEELTAVAERSGWEVERVETSTGPGGQEWIQLRARRT